MEQAASLSKLYTFSRSQDGDNRERQEAWSRGIQHRRGLGTNATLPIANPWIVSERRKSPSFRPSWAHLYSKGSYEPRIDVMKRPQLAATTAMVRTCLQLCHSAYRIFPRRRSIGESNMYEAVDRSMFSVESGVASDKLGQSDDIQ